MTGLSRARRLQIVLAAAVLAAAAATYAFVGDSAHAAQAAQSPDIATELLFEQPSANVDRYELAQPPRTSVLPRAGSTVPTVPTST